MIVPNIKGGELCYLLFLDLPLGAWAAAAAAGRGTTAAAADRGMEIAADRGAEAAGGNHRKFRFAFKQQTWLHMFLLLFLF